jgi:hypothetical protein
LAGLVLAGGFLDNRFLPLGRLGELASAGAIPLIYTLIGLKVGAEFSSILAHLAALPALPESPESPDRPDRPDAPDSPAQPQPAPSAQAAAAGSPAPRTETP